MADELKHKTVGANLTQAEFEDILLHQFNNQGTGDIPYASSDTQLSRLGIGSTGDILRVAGGVPTWKDEMKSASIVIAADNTKHKEGADYTCGVADNDVEILAAISELSPNGGLIQLLDGSFHISNTLNSGKFIGLKGQEGGRGTEITLADNSDCDMIAFGQTDLTSSFLYIGHLTLHGNSANQASGKGIRLYQDTQGFKDGLIDRVYVSDCKGNGMDLTGAWGMRIKDSLVENCGGEGYNIDGNQIYLSRCFSSNNAENGFKSTGQYQMWNTCFAFENDKDGFNFVTLPQLSLVCCIAHNNSQAGALANHNFLFNSVQDSTIIGCISRDTTSKVDVGFYASYSSKMTLIGCESTGTRYAVRVNPATPTVVVVGGYLEGSSSYDIYGIPGVMAHNVGFIAPGEVRSAYGSLTAGNANAICFSWHNPEIQDILIRKVIIEITTAGGVAGAQLDVGIADDTNGTNRGTEFFDDLDLDAAQINDSWVGGDGGTQTKWVFCEDTAAAIDDWIVGQILTQNAGALVGKYYIEYSGRAKV